MNYSKNLRKTAMAKRVILMLGIAAFIGFVIGSVLGYILKTHLTAENEGKTEVQIIEQGQVRPLIYGAYDDYSFTKEISIDWDVGDIDFIPIDCKMSEERQEFVYYLCSGYNLDFTLVMALIQHESNFNPSVISSTNDYGYMQINEINQDWLTETLGITDYTDPYQNIRAGTFVLRKLFERYQDTNMVLMAYNMGEKGASCLWRKGVFETEYTQSILTIQEQLNEQLEGD